MVSGAWRCAFDWCRDFALPPTGGWQPRADLDHCRLRPSVRYPAGDPGHPSQELESTGYHFATNLNTLRSLKKGSSLGGFFL